MKASPNITTMYLNIEITREENPFPKASKEPDTVIDREETINPALIKAKSGTTDFNGSFIVGE